MNEDKTITDYYKETVCNECLSCDCEDCEVGKDIKSYENFMNRKSN